jgi:hypothetical protein
MFTRLSHLSNHLNQSAVMKTYVQGPTVHYRDVALHNLRVVEYGLSVPGRGELGAHKIKLIPMAEFFNTEKFLNAN